MSADAMSDLFTNKITRGIERVEAALAAATPAARKTVEENSTLELSDWLDLGEMPSRMMLAGLVTLAEANALHHIHTVFSTSATTAERIVFMQAVSEGHKGGA